MYPPILLETVIKLTVKPTLWLFTSQKLTSRPHVFDRGKYAMHAAETVHSTLATVAVKSLELGTLRVMMPPMSRAMTCTASPTDLSSIVFEVLKPRSEVMIVEKELRIPLGSAAAETFDEDQDDFRVVEGQQRLRLVQCCILNTSLVLWDSFHSYQPLALIQESSTGWCNWKEDIDDHTQLDVRRFDATLVLVV